MNRVGLISIIILLSVVVLSFQACFDESVNKPTDVPSTNGNGGPYTGIQVVAPDEVESGVAFTISVEPEDDSQAEDIPSDINSRYDFRIVSGKAWIVDRIGKSSALIESAPDYLGSIFVEVLFNSEVLETIEIKVVAPQVVDIGARHSSFGYPMIVEDNLSFVSAHRAPSEYSEDAGQVLIFDNSSGSPQLMQIISNPSTDENKKYYGLSLAKYGRLLFIGSLFYNQVDVFEFNIGSGRYEIVNSLSVAGETRFGAKLQVHGNRLYVGSFSHGGKIRVYDIDQDFSLEEVIDAPQGFYEFGRNFQVTDSKIFVKSVRQEVDPNENIVSRFGAMHVYDLSSLTLDQSIVHYSDKSKHWGKVFLAHEDFLFIKYREQDESDDQLWKRHIDVYQLTSGGGSGRYVKLHALEDPQGQDVDHQFGRSMVAEQNRLFIGASKADTPTEKNSGAVHLYEKDNSSGQWKYNGLISPNYSEHDVVRLMGAGLYIQDDYLYISLRGSSFGDSSLPGQLYRLPISTPGAASVSIEKESK